MENGFILQLLVAAGVIAYGVWNAVQKSAEQKREQQDRSGEINPPEEEINWDEYFPPLVEISRQPESVNEVREARVEKGSRSKIKNEANYQLSTSSIETTNGLMEDMDNQSTEDEMQEASNKETITDLRTMIISSELLKPKYLEY